VPVVPNNPEASAVFQDLVALGNVINNHLYRYDTGVGYEVYSAAFTDINRGHGYWLWLSVANPDTVVSVAGLVASGDVQVALASGWNLIGHPQAAPVVLASCRVTDGDTTKTFADAVVAGWVGSSLYYWEPGVGYRILNPAGYADDDSLQPWRGYWFDAFVPNLQLIVPRPT